MTFVAGQDLGEQLIRRSEPFPLLTVLDWADQLLDVLSYLHTRQPPIVHRDTIDFDKGKARLTNIAKAKLDAVGMRLRDNPRATVEIVGYPDATGGNRGETLARQRAGNAKQYLVDRHGIDGSRIATRTDMEDRAKRGQADIVVTFRNN